MVVREGRRVGPTHNSGSPVVVGCVVHLEDISGPWSMAGTTLCVMRSLMVVNGIHTHPSVATWTVYLYHVLFHMNLDALFSGAPLAHPAYPLVLIILKEPDIICNSLLGPI